MRDPEEGDLVRVGGLMGTEVGVCQVLQGREDPTSGRRSSEEVSALARSCAFPPRLTRAPPRGPLPSGSAFRAGCELSGDRSVRPCLTVMPPQAAPDRSRAPFPPHPGLRLRRRSLGPQGRPAELRAPGSRPASPRCAPLPAAIFLTANPSAPRPAGIQAGRREQSHFKRPRRRDRSLLKAMAGPYPANDSRDL